MTWQRKVDKGCLHPGLVKVIDRAMEILAESFKSPFKAYSGLRSFAEQDKLYAQGRTEGVRGKIVTKARGGQSMHNYGLAVDLAPYNLLTKDPDDLWWPDPDARKGEAWWKLEEALFDAARSIDDELDDGVDYEWGGRWRGMRDVPHCQVRATLVELRSGHYPYCSDVEWLVNAHMTFLFDTPWMRRRVQHLLNMQSYDAGTVDGVFGSRSVTAMNRFQKDQDIVTNAEVERVTVGCLVRLHQEALSTPRGTHSGDL